VTSCPWWFMLLCPRVSVVKNGSQTNPDWEFRTWELNLATPSDMF